ncbi:hypothetical protein MUK42_05062 [Musa troglodytarum]|uniref:Uncharacterized protein n=1 Tax=Musa troglodytarum TaxID=320322 RepID=A0A9E7GMJ1_9LILI|nr:hypothetical protein MUK42_05062 [Musa troglodytarum]
MSKRSDEVEKTNSLSHDEVDIDIVAASDPDASGSRGVLTDKTSSLKTVALWVFAAVTFGVCLGFKDGVEKASEFFAGYVVYIPGIQISNRTAQYESVFQLIGMWIACYRAVSTSGQDEEYDGEEDEVVVLVGRRRELDVVGHEEALRLVERHRGRVLVLLGGTR